MRACYFALLILSKWELWGEYVQTVKCLLQNWNEFDTPALQYNVVSSHRGYDSAVCPKSQKNIDKTFVATSSSIW